MINAKEKGTTFNEKILGIILVLALTVALAACGGGDKSKTITVGASPAPHAEILEKAKPLLKKKGYDLQIKTINDYTTPNKLLDKGEIDANFFQHTPYLKTESKEKGYKIESAGNVELEPMAVYSKKYKSLKDLPKGATVYVSNNPAEQGRFLKFFVDEGLIKLKKALKLKMRNSVTSLKTRKILNLTTNNLLNTYLKSIKTKKLMQSSLTLTTQSIKN